MASIQKVSASKPSVQKPVQKNTQKKQNKKEQTGPKTADASKGLKTMQSYNQFVFAHR